MPKGHGCTRRRARCRPALVFELAEYNGFDAMPNWIDPFVGTPEERMAKLQRARGAGAHAAGGWRLDRVRGAPNAASDWRKMRIIEVRHPGNYQYEGLTIAELAAVTGKHPMDAMLDLPWTRICGRNSPLRPLPVQTRRRWRRS